MSHLDEMERGGTSALRSLQVASPPRLHSLFDCCNIAGHVIFARWGILGHDLLHCAEMPLADIQRPNEPVPIRVTLYPTTIGSVALDALIAIRTADIPQREGSTCHTASTEGAFMLEECQGVGVVNAVLHTQVIQRLAGTCCPGIGSRQHLIHKCC